MPTETKPERWIADTIGALFDPIIVIPGGWGDTLPDWLKEQVTIERLKENIIAANEKREVTATDAEAACYLYTASLSAPIGHDWTQIYMYVAGAAMKMETKGSLPDDLEVGGLTEDQWRQLKHLKDWIYRQRVKHRQEKAQTDRKEAHQILEKASSHELETKPAQASFF